MNKPGAKPGASAALFSPYPIKLFARPDVAECTDWPVELWPPSDLCEKLRSLMAWPPMPLPVRGIKSREDREACAQCPGFAVSSKRTLLAREVVPMRRGSSSASSRSSLIKLAE